jgi:tRNA U54 and U55 pseudouridine synthase Pus10
VLLVFVLQYPQNVTVLLFVLQYSRNVSQTRWIIDDERMGEASVEVPSILCHGSYILVEVVFYGAGEKLTE